MLIACCVLNKLAYCLLLRRAVFYCIWILIYLSNGFAGTLSVEVVKEAFDALTAVHGSGVLHGDIRPSHILVAKGQQAGVYLIDFGFARFIPSSEDCMREQTRLECLLNELSC